MTHQHLVGVIKARRTPSHWLSLSAEVLIHTLQLYSATFSDSVVLDQLGVGCLLHFHSHKVKKKNSALSNSLKPTTETQPRALCSWIRFYATALEKKKKCWRTQRRSDWALSLTVNWIPSVAPRRGPCLFFLFSFLDKHHSTKHPVNSRWPQVHHFTCSVSLHLWRILHREATDSFTFLLPALLSLMNSQVIESGEAAYLPLLLVETMICIISLCWENSNRDVLLYCVYCI